MQLNYDIIFRIVERLPINKVYMLSYVNRQFREACDVSALQQYREIKDSIKDIFNAACTKNYLDLVKWMVGVNPRYALKVCDTAYTCYIHEAFDVLFWIIKTYGIAAMTYLRIEEVIKTAFDKNLPRLMQRLLELLPEKVESYLNSNTRSISLSCGVESYLLVAVHCKNIQHFNTGLHWVLKNGSIRGIRKISAAYQQIGQKNITKYVTEFIESHELFNDIISRCSVDFLDALIDLGVDMLHKMFIKKNNWSYNECLALTFSARKNTEPDILIKLLGIINNRTKSSPGLVALCKCCATLPIQNYPRFRKVILTANYTVLEIMVKYGIDISTCADALFTKNIRTQGENTGDPEIVELAYIHGASKILIKNALERKDLADLEKKQLEKMWKYA